MLHESGKALSDAAKHASEGAGAEFTNSAAPGDAKRFLSPVPSEVLHSALENTTDSILMLSHDWRFIFLNGNAHANLAGGRDLIDQNIWEAFPDAANSPLWEALHRCLTKRVPTETKDVHASFGQFSEARAFPNETGGINVFLRNESEVVEQRVDLLRALGEASPNLLFAKDLAGRLLYANPATLAVIGQGPRDVLGRTETEWHFDSGQAHAISENDHHVFSSGQVQVVEEWFSDAQRGGSLRLFRSTKAPLRDPMTGQITGLAGVGVDVTDERSAQEALADSEMRLRSVLEVAEIGCWEYDLETGENRWDEALTRIMRCPDNLRTGLANDWTGVIHPEDRGRVAAAFRKAIESKTFYRAEFRIRTFDGEERIFSARGGYAGLRKFVGVAHDITEQRRFQKELEETEARFQETFDQAAVGMAHVGLDGQWLRVNGRICSMLGYSEAELKQLNFQELTYPDDLAEDLSNARDLVAGRKATYSIEKRYFRKDGSILWANLTVSLLRDSDGAPLHYISVIEDATARKNAEAAQVLSEQRWRTLAHALPHLVWTCRPDGSCDYLSPQWEEYTGSVATDGVGYNWINKIHPDDRDRLVERWRESVQTQKTFDCEARVRRADGVYRWFKKRAVALKDGAGVVQWFGTSTDITSEVHAREILERSASQLEAIVNERTKALGEANDRLALTEKLGALGKLASGIAHDFNNVLQAVKGGTDLIRRRTTDTNIKKVAEMMSQAADRGSSITRRLLAFSRKGELRKELVVLPQLLESITEVLSHTFPANITIRTSIAPDIPVLLIDRGHLETALLNIATNARDAMPEGGILSIEVMAERLDETNRYDLPVSDYLRIAVADTGVGIDPSLMSRVWEPFFTTKPQGQGTGLGLSMVRGFAEEVGGALVLESTKNVGTVVTMLLPLNLSAADQKVPQLVVARSEARVLVADDDRLVRELLMTQLTEAGYEVLAADSAETALAIIEDVPDVDVLVSDYAMTGMSGIGLIRQLRKMNKYVPVLLLTGNLAQDPDLLDGLGVSRSLRKPVSIGELVRAIEDLVVQSKST